MPTEHFFSHARHWAMRGALALALLVLLAMLAPMAMSRAQAASKTTPPKTTLADLPPAAQAAISESLGKYDAAYQFAATADGYATANVAHGLRADFSDAGLRLASDEAQWTMALQSIGYGDALAPVAQVAPTANANRLEYARGAVTEWYVNGPLGLEQGWTIT